MGIVIGIDVGGSSTKITGYNKGIIDFVPKLIKADDPLASLFGAFGKFISENKLKLDDIEKVMITGVGASYLNDKIYGLPTGKVDEFICVGLGGLYLSGLDNALVVSMGTGTAFVNAGANGQITHIGGTGVGGGTLISLARKLIGITSTQIIVDLAKNGDLSKVDLNIGDITTQEMNLPKYATASNFGKLSDLATHEDIALGLLNMIFQTIGMMAVFTSRVAKCTDVVLTGKLSTISQVEQLFNQLSEIYDIKYIIPKNSEYATSAGAALNYIKGMNYISV